MILLVSSHLRIDIGSFGHFAPTGHFHLPHVEWQHSTRKTEMTVPKSITICKVKEGRHLFSLISGLAKKSTESCAHEVRRLISSLFTCFYYYLGFLFSAFLTNIWRKKTFCLWAFSHAHEIIRLICQFCQLIPNHQH